QATAPERGAQLAQTDPNRFLSNDSSVGKVGLEKPKSTFNFEAQAAGIRAQISAASGSAKDPMLETRTWEPLDLSAPERGVKKSAEAVVRGLDQAAAPPPPPILEAATKTAPATKPGPSTKPDKVAVGETVAKSVPPAAPAPAAPVLAEAAPKVVQPKAVQKMPAQTVTIPKPVKTATAALGSAYALQLGAFSDQANAMRLVERLQAKGHQAGVSPVTDAKGRSLHSVRVSGYRSRAEAQAAAALLASTFKVKSFVVGPDTADRG
ncbi:MAG: SPOR domain-containing protein, partial [Rhodospirillales bacterium]